MKIGDFKSEYAGKLNFYVNTVGAQIKMPEHNPTIGVLLCKTPNNTVVKYSLTGMKTPLGVAEYELMPKRLKVEMPTIEELKQELQKEMGILLKPIDEKRQRLKGILGRITGEQIKKAKEAKDIIYLFNEVLIPLRKKLQDLLRNELELFAKKYIAIRINDSYDEYYVFTDLEAKLQKSNNVWKLGLTAYLDGFKPAGIKTFSMSKELVIELAEYKYVLKMEGGSPFAEYLYHHKWKDDELNYVAEQWSEQIVDEISRKAESVL